MHSDITIHTSFWALGKKVTVRRESMYKEKKMKEDSKTEKH